MRPGHGAFALEDIGEDARLHQMRARAHDQLARLCAERGFRPCSDGARTRAGRPRSTVPGLDFSHTHDRGWVGTVLAPVRVGLDAMRWRAVRPAITHWLDSQPPPITREDPDALEPDVARWTRVEAIIKYAGDSVLQQWRLTDEKSGSPAIARFLGAGGTVTTWCLPQGAVSLAHWRPLYLIPPAHLPSSPRHQGVTR